jgi:hypothetical protein
MEQETNFSTQQLSGQPVATVSSKNKKIALFLLIGPFVGLIATLAIYGITNFILNSTTTTTETPNIAASIIKLVLGFVGIICVFGILTGIPLSIIYLRKKEVTPGVKYDERSGKGEASVVPAEIKGWNWGAAGLTWIWGVYHGVWISLLVLIPLVNIIMLVILGLKGSEWAWKKQPWESVEKFTSSQRKWKPWGIVFFILGILGLLLELF